MVAMLAGGALPGWAAGGLRLEVSFDESAFPLQYGLGDGTAAGLYPLIVGAVGQRLGWALQLRARPFKRILVDLAAGDTCGGALVRTPELSGRLLLHSAPAGAQAVEGERPLAQTPIHFCVWHGLPRAVERMADFNAALRELVREGVVARLVERERQRQMP